jgi:lactate dehydrogenase-like 2-hydroxyacid dehydrogenase
LKSIDVLATGKMMPLIMEQLESTFTLHHLPAEGRDAFLASVGPRIRGVATGGHAKLDETMMGRLPKLEIVANFGVGYDSVDAKWAGSHGLIVTNTPDVLTEEVADTALGLLLMTARDLSRSERYLRAGRWEKEGAFPLSTSTLRDKTIGILALGRIGKAIAKRCEAFGLKIAYHGRSAQ